jgi:type II secretory pathway pseudopilin PulG
MFYQDPVAMMALRMRQVLPEIADSLSRANAEASPSVMYLYGEQSAIRGVSRSGGADVSAVLIGAAIAIPNLLRARIAANESSAVSAIRTANTAQIVYAAEYPQRGFARSFAALGPDPRGAQFVSAEHASVIDNTLANANCTADGWCTRSGFRFKVSAVCKGQRCQEFVVMGTPENGGTGSRNFCSTSDGVVRVDSGPPLTAPVSVSECLAWSALQ